MSDCDLPCFGAWSLEFVVLCAVWICVSVLHLVKLTRLVRFGDICRCVQFSARFFIFQWTNSRWNVIWIIQVCSTVCHRFDLNECLLCRIRENWEHTKFLAFSVSYMYLPFTTNILTLSLCCHQILSYIPFFFFIPCHCKWNSNKTNKKSAKHEREKTTPQIWYKLKRATKTPKTGKVKLHREKQ